ncbi:MAG: CHAT domain-containing protein [Chloroflexales bacterium]
MSIQNPSDTSFLADLHKFIHDYWIELKQHPPSRHSLQQFHTNLLSTIQQIGEHFAGRYDVQSLDYSESGKAYRRLYECLRGVAQYCDPQTPYSADRVRSLIKNLRAAQDSVDNFAALNLTSTEPAPPLPIALFLDPEDEILITFTSHPDKGNYELQLERRNRIGTLRTENVSQVKISMERLREDSLNIEAIGIQLGKALFNTFMAVDLFSAAKSSAENAQRYLRVRLVYPAEIHDLHELPWEAACVPDKEPAERLFGERVAFSRRPQHIEITPGSLVPKKDDLRSLIVVSAPSNPEYYNLARIDRSTVIAQALAALKPLMTQQPTICRDGQFAEILSQLRNGFHILYLVAHGCIVNGTPQLFLEDDKGAATRVNGLDLAKEIRQLSRRPTLAFLTACHSGERASSPTEIPPPDHCCLGAHLVSSGVGAVIAMRGPIFIPTAQVFAAALFRELARDGFIDRAVSAARTDIMSFPDAWAPVLYMSLEDGRLWIY